MTLKRSYYKEDRPRSVDWFINNFNNEVDSIQISVPIFLEFRRFLSEIFDLETHQVQIKRGLVGYIYGINIFVNKMQKDHLTQVTFKNESISTLCDDHGWNDGLKCTYNECIIREIHDS